MNLITKINDIIFKIERLLAILLCITLLLSLSGGVIFRYIFSKPLIWSDELALFCLAWVTFIGGSIGLKKRLSPSITILSDSVPPKFKKLMLILSNLVLLFFISYLLYISIVWITGPTIATQISISLHWPKFYFYLCLPISFIFMIFHILELILQGSKDENHNTGGSIQ